MAMNDRPKLEENNHYDPNVVRPLSAAPLPPIELPKLPENEAPSPVLVANQNSELPAELNGPSGFRELMSTLGILLTAFIVAMLMIVFVFRSYQVDGPSMETTLSNADKLIIWKVPRTWANITNKPYIPDRGDIIVYTQNGLSEFGQVDTKQLIKRVVGLPGERVVVRNGELTVYNAENPQGFQPDKLMPYGNVIESTTGDVDVTLGPEQLFTCGDNRGNSLDSRTFGPVNADQIIGKLVLKVFPIGEAKAF